MSSEGRVVRQSSEGAWCGNLTVLPTVVMYVVGGRRCPTPHYYYLLFGRSWLSGKAVVCKILTYSEDVGLKLNLSQFSCLYSG